MYECVRCAQSFSESRSLKRHLRSQHIKSKAYACAEPSCGRTYARRDQLQRHCRNSDHKPGPVGQAPTWFDDDLDLEKLIRQGTVHRKDAAMCMDVSSTSVTTDEASLRPINSWLQDNQHDGRSVNTSFFEDARPYSTFDFSDIQPDLAAP